MTALTYLIIGAVATVWILVHCYKAALEDHFIEHLDRQVRLLERQIRLSNQDVVDAIVAQLGKAKDEIIAKIADTQAQLDAAGADSVDLSALISAAQALDDIVPDPAVEVEEPVEEADGEATE